MSAFTYFAVDIAPETLLVALETAGFMKPVCASADLVAGHEFDLRVPFVERRMTLDVRTGDGVLRAVNEAVLEKTMSGHTVRLALSIDGEELVTYAADGLIIATPTGSTAYNLSVRGPIVSPTHRGIVVTPVSAHMLFDRSLVLDAEQTVTVHVLAEKQARLVVDGQAVGVVDADTPVELAASSVDAALVRFGPPDFHRVLRAKFGLSDR